MQIMPMQIAHVKAKGPPTMYHVTDRCQSKDVSWHNVTMFSTAHLIKTYSQFNELPSDTVLRVLYSGY